MLSERAPNALFTREWLETNGIGGYASGTVSGAVSRRYHAFLCAATRAPQERRVLVSKISETLWVGDAHFCLDSNFWPHQIWPRGDFLIESFDLDPLPRWVFAIPTLYGPFRLQKTLWMPREKNATIALYRILELPPDAPQPVLEVRAFVTGRDYHSTHRANGDFLAEVCLETPTRTTMRPYEHLPLVMFDSTGEFEWDGHWYFNFEWPIEAERGLDYHEDAYSPGCWRLAFGEKGDQDAVFCASTEGVDLGDVENCRARTVQHRRALAGGDDWNAPLNRLKRAADQPIVRREDGLHTVLAGYHWFTDWGRDTMIALPGLCLTTKRFEVAASILKAFAGALDGGMIPNRFPDAGETPDYNTVDGTLWFFHAVAEFGRASGDRKTLEFLYPKLVESIEYHLAGTRYGIVADPEDGMLRAGDETSQLTWMDAKIGNVAFTPRAGKPVEIQALWHNALCEMVILARQMNDEKTALICLEWSRKIAANFGEVFWNEGEGCLYDFVDGDHKDGAIRPNQLLAVSLPNHLLSREQEKSVVAVCERELLTPHGMRSLSPRDSRYRGVYIGDSWSRDSAYHQGTVWAWPIGPFLSAYLKVHDRSDKAKLQVRAWLLPLLSHLDEAGVGSISEIFDGDAPHAPRGCIAQAWSVSEILRVWEESRI